MKYVCDVCGWVYDEAEGAPGLLWRRLRCHEAVFSAPSIDGELYDERLIQRALSILLPGFHFCGRVLFQQHVQGFLLYIRRLHYACLSLQYGASVAGGEMPGLHGAFSYNAK